MKIRFESTVDHLIAFSIYHHANSPVSRGQRWFGYAVFPVVFCVVGGLAILQSVGEGIGDPVAFVIGGALFVTFATAVSIAIYFVSPWYRKWQFTHSLRKLFANGSNRDLFGWRDMELANSRLLLKTELTQLSIDLRAIEKIVTTEDYTFVYISSVSAHIIPMNLYPEDEYRQFVEELRAAWENYDHPHRADEPPNKAPVDDRFTERPPL